ncbi:MAG: HAD hydrolase-like protein [Christensenellaceae bacterium]
MFDTYVFDLDGTLLDTLDDLTSSVNAALEAFGCPVRSREEVRGFVGNGIRLLVRRAAPCGRFRGNSRRLRRITPRIVSTKQSRTQTSRAVDPIEARGAKTAIVSNKADFAVRELSPLFRAYRRGGGRKG